MIVKLSTKGTIKLNKIVYLLNNDNCIICGKKMGGEVFAMASESAGSHRLWGEFASSFYNYLLKMVKNQTIELPEYHNVIVICHKECFKENYPQEGWEYFTKQYFKEFNIKLEMLRV